MRTSDITGREFGRLKVFSREADRRSSGGYPEPYWKCVCLCGQVRTIRAYDLFKGNTNSCGCLKRENAARKTHGMAAHRSGKRVHTLYSTWAGMIQRCSYPKSISWRYYGGRGINVCKRWRWFPNFLKDMGPTWKPGLTLDRKDSRKDYKPSNCQWATWKVQNDRTRRVVAR